jgi:Arc/MetJ-type ribon-helix-helix transcriptional regulator
MNEYVTSEDELEELPDDEVTIQITDKSTKEIFRTRAKVADEPDDLSDPAPLTVVRGPHENVQEQWYIEILDASVDGEGIDRELLRESIQQSRTESNIVNARSDDLRSLLVYLVKTGEYASVSEGVREILLDHLSADHPDLIEAYAEVRAELDREDLTAMLDGDHE